MAGFDAPEIQRPARSDLDGPKRSPGGEVVGSLEHHIFEVTTELASLLGVLIEGATVELQPPHGGVDGPHPGAFAEFAVMEFVADQPVFGKVEIR